MGSQKLKDLFNKIPTKANHRAIKKWTNLHRMTVEEIMNHTLPAHFNIQPEQLEFREGVVDGIAVRSGFFIKGTEQLKIGREEFKGEYILEGTFNENAHLDGYGRAIWDDGDYYFLGEWKNGHLHGYGKDVSYDG